MPQGPGLPIDRLRASLAEAYTVDRELGRGTGTEHSTRGRYR